jgi:CubicO group peptidase (beta-lactamase class C family)
MKLNATMWLASCTKLMTSVAAMQCVERGLLNLDEDVTRILPELKGREILKGFEKGSGKPILVPNNKAITLRFATAR